MADCKSGGEPPAIEAVLEGGDDMRPPDPQRARLFGWFRRFAKLWGFALFCIFVVYVFRDVALPFVFAVLVAYILAPLVDRMARLRVASRPLPRGLAVIFLYINILVGLGLFIGYFLPKLSGDIARVFREAPELFEKLNSEVLPKVGSWIDDRFGAGVPAAAGALASRLPGRPSATGWCSSRWARGATASTSTSMHLEVRPAGEGSGLPGRAPPPRGADGPGRGPLGAIAQAVDRRSGQDAPSRRAGGPWSSGRSSSPGSSPASPG